MGEDKYLMEVNGKPQYQHLYELLSEMKIPTYLSCNELQHKVISDQYRKIVDRFPDSGPIGGIVSATYVHPESSWLVIACDLVRVTEEAIARLIAENKDTYDVVTFKSTHQKYFETTLSIYNPGAFGVLREALRLRQLKLQTTLKKCVVHILEVQDVSFLKNVNTREDLKDL